MGKFPLQAVIASTLMINFSLSQRLGIIGGDETVIQKYPYQAAFLWNGKLKCGASIIGKLWALTAGKEKKKDFSFCDINH